jgi:phosphoribosyl-ATP pyrophosphohydrolase
MAKGAPAPPKQHGRRSVGFFIHPHVLEAPKRNIILADDRTFTLHDLAARVKERAKAGADESYTRKLLDKGVAHIAKKFGEEAAETVIAAVSEDKKRVISEAADLLYHLVVLLEARGIGVSDVEQVLRERTAQSGLAEKASRSR